MTHDTSDDGIDDDQMRSDGGTATAPQASAEQLAPGDDDGSGDPAPRGEDRSDDSFVFSVVADRKTQTWRQYKSRHRTTTDAALATDDDRITPQAELPPPRLSDLWNKWYYWSLTGVPLSSFADRVVEPGWTVSATKPDGSPDEDMTDALTLWGENAAIHGNKAQCDISVLLRDIPAHRRGKGTLFIEEVGTAEAPEALAALVMHDPSTFRIYKRENKPLVLQPDDDVDDPNLQTPTGKTACYVQYDEALDGFDDEDPIYFAEDEMIRLTYEADHGRGFGTSLYARLDERASALRTKLGDRDHAIRMTGHPHRIYNSKGWTQQEAKDFAQAYKKGEMSVWDDDVEEDPDSFAGRTDFISDDIDVSEVEGRVAGLDGVVKDDVEMIFAPMPISKFKIAYADQINQFVVEPQQEEDQTEIDQERRYLEREFLTPVFQKKANQLASGDAYEGTVSVSIEPDQEDNPLLRESWPRENVTAFADAWGVYAKQGLDQFIPPAGFADMLGFDLDAMREEFDWEPEEVPALDEASEEVQQQIAEADDQPTVGEQEDDG